MMPDEYTTLSSTPPLAHEAHDVTCATLADHKALLLVTPEASIAALPAYNNFVEVADNNDHAPQVPSPVV